ncbi:MAG: peptidyl-prolyl cis-trans isomerase [Verrucomicrobia bacterium]|nr:peptidyl-prolyl cis-trans isomerase [Verrucomicrobiota bacterium]
MISWIQRYFQHHFKLVFLVVLLTMAVPMVFIYNQSSGIGQSERTSAKHLFFGRNLASENEMASVQRETQLSSGLHQQNGNVLFRISALAIADQLGLPGPTDGEFKEFIKTLPAFLDEKGQFDASTYNRIQADIRKSNQEALFARVIKDDYRISRVTALLGGPGYVLPHEVKTQLERFETTWTLGLASVDYKSFNPTIAPSDADLTKFFADNAARYEIQPQISVRMAEFSSVDFLDKVSVTDEEIKAFYDANPARFTKPEEKVDATKPAAPAKPADFASVRLQAELSLKVERAARLATKAAAEFSLELFNKKIVPGTPAFFELIASRKITLKDVPPFSADEPPQELSRNPEAAAEAFKLNKDRLYSDAVSLATGSAVLFWGNTFAARQPQFIEVKAKVSADYSEQEKYRRFTELGKTIRSQLEARLKAGDNFDKAITTVSASSAAKLEGKTLAPFTLRQRPQDIDYSVLGALEALKKGDVSEMVMNQQGKAQFVYAAEKKLPDLSETNPQYKFFQFQLAQNTAMRNSAEYLRELADTEMAKSAPAAAK